MSKEIENAMDLAPLSTTGTEVTIVEEVEDHSNDQIEADFDYARNNIKEIIEKTFSALDELSSVAQQSQHPRAYEVLNAMLKTAVDINKDLLDIQKSKKELLNRPDEGAKTVNNNLFVGTPADLNKYIEDRRNGALE